MHFAASSPGTQAAASVTPCAPLAKNSNCNHRSNNCMCVQTRSQPSQQADGVTPAIRAITMVTKTQNLDCNICSNLEPQARNVAANSVSTSGYNNRNSHHSLCSSLWGQAQNQDRSLCNKMRFQAEVRVAARVGICGLIPRFVSTPWQQSPTSTGRIADSSNSIGCTPYLLARFRCGQPGPARPSVQPRINLHAISPR